MNVLHKEFTRQTEQSPFYSAGVYKPAYVKWLETMAMEFLVYKTLTFILIATNLIFIFIG